VRLEENYRSNSKKFWTRPGKSSRITSGVWEELISTRSTGGNLVFFEARDSKAEAEYAADRIRILHGDDPPYTSLCCMHEFAVARPLRALAAAAALPDARRLSFYKRAESRMLAYARLAIFPGR